MSKLRKLVLIFGAVILLCFMFPGIAVADDETVYPYSDSYIREGLPSNNYGSATYLCINDYSESATRTVIRVDNQSGVGNVTDVVLRLYYYDYYEDSPSGRVVQACRLTKTYNESQVSWLKRTTSSWTTPGSDYTTSLKADVSMPGPYGWVEWDITDMALYQWSTLGGDLYLVLKFKYETKDADECAITWFRSSEYSNSAYRPQVVVTYSEEEQAAEVDGVITSYSDDSVDMEINPQLHGWASATVYSQVSEHGEDDWEFESTGQVVEDDTPVTEVITGLDNDTEYDCRAKLVYNTDVTVYSVPEMFTTMAYAVPVFDKDYSELEINSVKLTASYTGNTDLMSIDFRVAYKEASSGQWLYTGWHDSSLSSASYDWVIDELYDSTPMVFKGQFDIDGYVYESSVGEFEMGSAASLDASIDDKGIDFLKVKVDYDMEDADGADVYCKIRAVGYSSWTVSAIVEDVNGAGTLYFEFDGLEGATQYQYVAVADWETGSTTSLFYSYVWTEDIDIEPVISELDAQFIAPNTMRLKVYITLGDAAEYNPVLHFMLKQYSYVVPYWSTGTKVVSADGESYVDLIVGDSLEWGLGYDFYGVLDYTVGTLETEADWFNCPEEPFWVGTLEPIGLSGTSVMLRGQIQMDDVPSTYIKFYYWVSGTSQKISTQEVEISSSGVFDWQLDGLVYGQAYSYQAWASFGQSLGSVVTFRAGYWAAAADDDDGTPWVPSLPTMEGFTNFVNWFTNSTVGHWLILLLGMGITALIFYRKHRSVALILCLVILGIGIVVGWIDTWIIVLLALGGGLTIWKMISASRRSEG